MLVLFAALGSLRKGKKMKRPVLVVQRYSADTTSRRQMLRGRMVRRRANSEVGEGLRVLTRAGSKTKKVLR